MSNELPDVIWAIPGYDNTRGSWGANSFDGKAVEVADQFYNAAPVDELVRAVKDYKNATYKTGMVSEVQVSLLWTTMMDKLAALEKAK